MGTRPLTRSRSVPRGLPAASCPQRLPAAWRPRTPPRRPAGPPQPLLYGPCSPGAAPGEAVAPPASPPLPRGPSAHPVRLRTGEVGQRVARFGVQGLGFRLYCRCIEEVGHGQAGLCTEEGHPVARLFGGYEVKPFPNKFSRSKLDL